MCSVFVGVCCVVVREHGRCAAGQKATTCRCYSTPFFFPVHNPLPGQETAHFQDWCLVSCSDGPCFDLEQGGGVEDRLVVDPAAMMSGNLSRPQERCGWVRKFSRRKRKRTEPETGAWVTGCLSGYAPTCRQPGLTFFVAEPGVNWSWRRRRCDMK